MLDKLKDEHYTVFRKAHAATVDKEPVVVEIDADGNVDDSDDSVLDDLSDEDNFDITITTDEESKEIGTVDENRTKRNLSIYPFKW